MGATALCDFIGSWLPPHLQGHVQISCVFDSNLPIINVPSLTGISLDGLPIPKGHSMTESAGNMMNLFNISRIFKPACLAENPGKPWICTLAEHILPRLTTPYFVNINKFDAYGAAIQTGVLYAWLPNYPGFFGSLLPWPFFRSFVNAMNIWGDEQARVSAPLPTAAQPGSGVFQAGCVQHCGMNGPLYANVVAGGATMQDAIHSWFTRSRPPAIAASPPSRESRRWVYDADYRIGNGECYGYHDGWVVFFRSLALLWVVGTVHLTLRHRCRRSQPDVMVALQAAVAAAMTKVGKDGVVSAAAWGVKQQRIVWCVLWAVCWVINAVGRWLV
eukprot:SAG22_NODE_460_length_10218_cov_5.663109_2_plen_331_part_00